MAIINTIAILGAVENPLSFIARRIPQQYKVLLFDKDPLKLAELYNPLLVNDPLTNMEQMNCATNASWEADIVMLSAACCADGLIIEKIKQVSIGKIVIIIKDEINAPLFSKYHLSLQQSLQHAKLVQVTTSTNPAKTDVDNKLTILGNDHASLETVDLLFRSADFTTNISLIPIP